MKLTAIILTGALGAGAQTGVLEHQQVTVPVYLVSDDVPAPDRVVDNLAQVLTSRIFADIGVKIQWQRNRLSAGLRMDHSILITVTTKAPKTGTLHTLAAAEPFGMNQITVFFGRVTGRHSPKSTAILLSYVMAHEMAHVLEGIDYHAPSGIMRSHWDSDDFSRMDMRKLTFTTHDVELINNGLASWDARPAAASWLRTDPAL